MTRTLSCHRRCRIYRFELRPQADPARRKGDRVRQFVPRGCAAQSRLAAGNLWEGLLQADRWGFADADSYAESAKEADVIVHLAGQVAVTTSVTNPRDDFEANALGTFNALEAARLIRAKSNLYLCLHQQSYGGMDDVELIEEATRWLYKDLDQGCPKRSRWIFILPMAVQRGQAINMSAIIRVFTGYVRWSFVKAASMGRVNLAWKTRAGWHG